MEINITHTELVILILVLVIKQVLNLVHMVMFYSSMVPMMRYIRGVLIVVAIGTEVIFAFSLSLGISLTAGLFLTIIALLELVTSLVLVPFDYRSAVLPVTMGAND